MLFNSDRRPVKKPPVLSHDHMIDGKHQKKRAAVPKYLDGDVVKATAFWDTNIEQELLEEYVVRG